MKIEETIPAWLEAVGTIAAFLALWFTIKQLISSKDDFNKQFTKLSELVEKQGGMLETMNNELKTEQFKYKNTIKPFFTLTSNNGNYDIGISLVNTNGIAYEVSLNSTDNANVTVRGGYQIDLPFVLSGQKVNLNFKMVKEELNKPIKNENFTSDLFFNDAIGNEYFQTISWNALGLRISEPKEIQ